LLLHVIPTAFDLLVIMLCIGLLATAAWVIPPDMAGVKGLHDDLQHLLGPLLGALTAMSVIGLLQRSAEMSGRPWGEVFSSLPPVLLETHYGMTWFVRIASIIVLWLFWCRRRKHAPRRVACAMLLAAACLAWTVSASSHGADWGDFTLAEWMWSLHIMGASLWVGSIMIFVLVIRRRLRAQPDRAQALFTACAGRLSGLAGMALAVVLITGAYNAWHQLRHISDLWSSSYGRILLFKLALVGVMAAIAAFNRFFTLPLLLHSEGGLLPGQQTGLALRVLRQWYPSWRPREAGALARRFAHGVTVEAWLALGVLLCAALLAHTMPPKEHAAFPYPKASIGKLKNGPRFDEPPILSGSKQPRSNC